MGEFLRTILFLCFTSSILALDMSTCIAPLGMESGEIPDEDLSASSSFEVGNVGPQNGRVRVERQGGAWCPKNQITSDAEEWLQIDLHSVHVISGVETQGRFGNGQGAEYAEAYVVSYWRPELNKWVRYRDYNGNEILKGNVNTYLPSKTVLNPPIIASKVKVLPHSHHRRTVCMRVEIYGCNLRGGLLSYTMPQGTKRGEHWNFYDHTYDGVWDGHRLKNGLGQLTDGREGHENFKDDFYGPLRGRSWVGWRNETGKNASNNPIEILFKFDVIQEFHAVHIHTSNQFTKDVQVFREARVEFSGDGETFVGEGIVQSPEEDAIFEDPRNITINLHRRVGRFVRISLFFASKWILLSEVTFQSHPVEPPPPPAPPQEADKSTVDSLAPFGTARSEVSNISTTGEDTNPLLAQSDASDFLPRDGGPSGGAVEAEDDLLNGGDGETIPNDKRFAGGQWSVFITSVASAVVAVALVLTIVGCVVKARRDLLAGGRGTGGMKGPPSSDGSLPYSSEGVFGEEGLKGIGLSGEYTEPFTPVPPLITFPNHSGGGDKKAEYYSVTLIPTNNPSDSCNEYEYAVPNELGKLLPSGPSSSPLKTLPNSPHNRLRLVQRKFRELGVPEIPSRHVRMLRKLGDGAFGTVFVGELDIPLSGSDAKEKSLVAVKNLLQNATEKDKSDFLEEVRLLSSLQDPNVAQVLGICIEEEPFGVVLEFLELGDLCQFLRENDSLLPNSSKKKIKSKTLLFIASQIASGMKFLEGRNIVHRDLATRNCVVGEGFTVKISHFATDTDLYASDYYRLDGNLPLPVRWMAWESIFMGKYSTKSDVWSFGVTLWEVLTYCRRSPYPTMSNDDVLGNLRLLMSDDPSAPFDCLARPPNVHREVYQLMCDTWRRNDEERPSFWEIHSFISRKCLSIESSHLSTNSRTNNRNNNIINVIDNPQSSFLRNHEEPPEYYY